MVILRAFDFWRLRVRDGFPGAGDDVFIVGNGFRFAETLHFGGHAVHQVNDGRLQRAFPVRKRILQKCLDEALFIIVESFRQWFAGFDGERLFLGDRDGFFFEQTEHNHGQNFIQRFLHQNSGFHRGQAALDALSFDRNLGRHIRHFSFLMVFNAFKNTQNDKGDKNQAAAAAENSTRIYGKAAGSRAGFLFLLGVLILAAYGAGRNNGRRESDTEVVVAVNICFFAVPGIVHAPILGCGGFGRIAARPTRRAVIYAVIHADARRKNDGQTIFGGSRSVELRTKGIRGKLEIRVILAVALVVGE